MGNSVGGEKSAKVMKISGETMKFKTPVKAEEVMRDHPGLVVLESESVKHYGVRAKPLEAHQELDPKRLYFLVELPIMGMSSDDSRQGRDPRRVRSAINMSAKERLENLVLARRSVSDLSIVNPTTPTGSSSNGSDVRVSDSEKRGGVRVKMRLPKAEVERVMRESKDEAEAAEKIMNLYIDANNSTNNNTRKDGVQGEELLVRGEGSHGGEARRQVRVEGTKKREKKVSFVANRGGDMEVAVAS